MMTIRRMKSSHHPLLRRKGLRGRKPRKERRRLKAFLTLIIIIGLLYGLINYIENELMPTVMAISKLRIETLSTKMINNAVNETLINDKVDTESLVTYYYDKEGNFQSVGVNSVLVNQVNSGIVSSINNEINHYEKERLSIPLGKLLGRSVFSNSGPRIHISIMPYGTVKTNYKSSFVATGINQINHRIWLNVEMTMQVVVPLNSTQVKVCQEITLVDRVVSGQIPDQYINVPKDEVLNVVN